MTRRIPWLATALCAIAASTVSAQTPGDEVPLPAFSVVVVVRPLIADFDALVLEYVDLRTTLEEGLPAVHITDNPDENISIRRALARRIQRARSNAVRGDIFTPAIASEFRRILLIDMKAGMLAAILDDNPGQFRHRINGTYPHGKPRSTMPGRILAVLPVLPDGIEYRFLGHDLILHDTRANVILDRLPCALECIEAAS